MDVIKEYQVKLDDLKRPVLVTKSDMVCEISGKYDEPYKVVEILNQMFDVAHLAEEYVWVMCFTSDMHVTGVFEVSHGSVARSMFPKREILQKSLLAGAVYIIVAHCHPSGDPTPSDNDIVLTEQLKDACECVGLSLVDHVIVGCSLARQYYSFNEEGAL